MINKIAFDPEKIDIPKGWIRCSLKDIGEIYSGGTPSSRELSFWGDEIAWVTPADLSGYKEMYISKGKKSITKYGLQNSSAKTLPGGSVLFSSRAPIGYVAIASETLTTNQGFKNIVPYGGINSQYLYYYLLCIKHVAIKKASGTTFKEISSTKFAMLPLLLCPSNEQEKIVAKINELFQDLDNGKAKLEIALEQIQTYRQSILKWAFEGRLTNKNSKEGILPKLWKLKPLRDLTQLITKGSSPKWQGFNYITDDNQLLFITSENVRDNFIDIDKPKYLDLEFNKVQKRSVLQNGDVLFNLVGASIGRAAIFDLKKTANINQAVALIRLKNTLNKKYLSYFLNSEVAKQKYLANVVDVARANLSLTDTANIEIPLCPYVEQIHVVREIESRLRVCEKFEKTITESKKQSESLRQSILQNAFEGKLIEQNPDDETVELLLEKIKREREIYIKEEKRKRRDSPRILKFNDMPKQLETIIQLLQKSNKPIAAQTLWKSSEHADDIDAFYAQLKKHFDKGEIKETRKGKESFLTTTK